MGTLEDVKGRVTKQQGFSTTCGSARGKSSRILTQSKRQLQPPPWAQEVLQISPTPDKGRDYLEYVHSTWLYLWCWKGPSVMERDVPATALGDCNLDMKSHAGPPKALVGLFHFMAALSCCAWPAFVRRALIISIYQPKLGKHCSLYMARQENETW